MGILKIKYEPPATSDIVGNLLCKALVDGALDKNLVWETKESLETVFIYGMKAYEVQKLKTFADSKMKPKYKNHIKFLMLGFKENDYPKPKDSWEALHYMLQDFH